MCTSAQHNEGWIQEYDMKNSSDITGVCLGKKNKFESCGDTRHEISFVYL